MENGKRYVAMANRKTDPTDMVIFVVSSTDHKTAWQVARNAVRTGGALELAGPDADGKTTRTVQPLQYVVRSCDSLDKRQRKLKLPKVDAFIDALQTAGVKLTKRQTVVYDDMVAELNADDADDADAA